MAKVISIEATPSLPGVSRGWAPPRWASPVSVALALCGLGVSVYLTAAHYATGVVLACPDTGAINCEKVTTSPQSVIAGIPVAVLGVGFFAAMVVLNLPRAWRSAAGPLALTRLALAVSGVGFALYLVYTELFSVHAICLWCTAAHVLAFSIFVAVLVATTLARPVTTARH